MRSISFDKPWWLLLFVLLAAIIVIPYVISINKDNKSKATVTSLVLHLIIAACLVLSIAGMIFTAVITETEVYFVADVSYSSNKNMENIDQYIQSVSKNLPRNSKVGLVCFGKDFQLITKSGGKITSVKDANVDETATDIASALNYTASLFKKDTIKRIVLITDGRATSKDASSNLVAAVENLYAKNIYIDAIFLNNNLKDGETEVQVSGVDYTTSTYLNHENTADVLIQAGADMQGIVTLSKDGEKIAQKAIELHGGYNIVNFDLISDKAGEFNYEVKVSSDDDISEYNNTYAFTQTVSGDLNVLLVTSNPEDEENAHALYGESAVIDSYCNNPKVPVTVEEICKYDEIIISGVDVRGLENYTAFIDSVDKAVSLFGKSLVTIGDLKIQNKTDEVLGQLEDMLPVKFGNSARDPKLYGIVIDTSRSMQMAGRLIMAKQAAIQLLNLLDDDDYVAVVAFSGEPKVIRTATPASNREEIAKLINSIEPTHGTVMGAAMEEVYKLMKDLSYSEKQVMLLSDGMSYALEKDDPIEIASKMYEAGIQISTVNTCNQENIGIQTLNGVAEKGHGKYYYLQDVSDVKDLVFGEMGDDLTDTVVDKEVAVEVMRGNDSMMQGVVSLPNIFGYIHSKEKAEANTVLTVPYQKEDGSVVNVPLYSYWKYGNGKVATFTSDFLGKWTGNWKETDGETFAKNLIPANTPGKKIDYPYNLNVENNGVYTSLEVIPATINPFASVDVTVRMPDGTTLTETLYFDQTRYYYEFETPVLGEYEVEVAYNCDEAVYSSKSTFHVSYTAEYDSFAVCSAATLNTAIRDRGVVHDNADIEIVNDDKEAATYTMDFALPLLIVAIVLYIADIIIRKLKWNDILSLFKRTTVKGG